MDDCPCFSQVFGANRTFRSLEELSKRLNITERAKPTTNEIWGFGLLFVTIISSCSVVGACFLPLVKLQCYDGLMITLIGLAMGSLSSSAMFHLLPQAFRLPEIYGHGNHEYLFIALAAMAGIYGFFVIERLLKTIIEHKRRKHATNRPPEPIFYGPSPQSEDLSRTEGTEQQFVELVGVVDLQNQPVGNPFGSSPSVKQVYEAQQPAIKASFGHQTRPKLDKHATNHQTMFMDRNTTNNNTTKPTISTIAWMVIFGDGIHNFIDGISVGAAFSESTLVGISVSVAIICEELPHELGDLAVLLNSGMTLKQAVVYNFLSALTSYAGLVVGVVLGNLKEAGCYVFGLAAGMFLYIALADMVPEMNEAAEKASKQSVLSVIRVLTLQSLGFALGVAALFMLAYHQDEMSLNNK